MTDSTPTSEYMATIQQDVLSHLERASQSVLKVKETLDLIGSEPFAAPIRERLIEALAGELHATYTGFEAVAARLLKAKGIRFEKSGTHHAEVLNAVINAGILTGESMKDTFFDLLGFRHFYRNSYGVDFRSDEVVEKAQNLCDIWPEAEKALSDSIDQLSTPKASAITPLKLMQDPGQEPPPRKDTISAAGEGQAKA